MTPPVALTIAGSDSGGGAGIQADLKSFAANGVYGTSALTALTAQDTTGVHGVHIAPVDVVVDQIDTVLGDFDVGAVKTGMLATAEIVLAVAEFAAAGRLPNLVVDPVMVATSGDRLLAPEAERAYVERLFPHAAVITPNLAEAETLVGASLGDLDTIADAGRALLEHGPATVVIKGGHLDGDAVDAVVDRDGVRWLRLPRVDTGNSHGTGCSFAAATAAFLARGDDTFTALERAKGYVHRSLIGGRAWQLGHGHGPIDHFGWEA